MKIRENTVKTKFEIDKNVSFREVGILFQLLLDSLNYLQNNMKAIRETREFV